MENPEGQMRIDYGLDAPGLVQAFIFGGLTLALLGLFSESLKLPELFSGFINPGFCFVFTGLTMVFYSYFGKFRARDHLIQSLQLKGHETLLDLGCGRGLLLIGGAKSLPQGKAIGIDLWSQKDLSNNSEKAVLQNAQLEGVRGRVEIINGDMRKIPLPNASVDVVVASMAIHNIPTRSGREEAVREAVRVLKPGGKMALLDFKSTGQYADVAKSLGIKNVRRPFSLWCFPPSRIVYGEK